VELNLRVRIAHPAGASVAPTDYSVCDDSVWLSNCEQPQEGFRWQNSETRRQIVQRIPCGGSVWGPFAYC